MTRVHALLVAVLVAAALSRPHAAATDLFISEIIEGTSNNKAIEIYNGTGAAVDLAGYSLQMYFNGSATAGLTITLTGTVAAGDVHVVAQALAGAAILAQADQTNGAGWFNGDDAVALVKNGTAIDVVGQIGFDPGTEWGTGFTSTADNTLRRGASICQGDADSSNAFDPGAQWVGFATDTFDGLGSHSADCGGGPAEAAPAVTGVTPADGATGVPVASALTVTFSEPVTFGPSSLTLVCSVSGTKTVTVSGGPSAFTIDPSVDFASGDSCTLTILGAQVADADAVDPPDTMLADVISRFAVLDACAAPSTPIPQIQGSGAATALTGTQTTRGIVVGDYEGVSPALRGFYIQDPSGDGNALTSDGLFVFNGNLNSVSLGDEVVVTGTVSEFQGQTQISATAVTRCGTGTVTPVDVTLPMASAEAFEPYEGMLVTLPQTLTVTEHFQLGRFGQVVVSSGGRLRQPTDVVAPGAPALDLQAQNALNRLIIDDASNGQNPDPIVFGRGGQPLSAQNTLRAGDTVTSTVGVMTYTWAGNAASGNAFRVRPIGALDGHVDFEPANPRPAGAPAPAGTLRVASMNVLNFFNTFAGCGFGVGGAPADCRGAESQVEFDRQWPKTVAAILGTRADVVGLMEVENDGYGADSALAFLVNRLNDATAPGTWAFIDADAPNGANALGTDAIKVALLYRTSRVAPIGNTAVLNTVDFVNGGDGAPRNRAALAQAFEQLTTGARLVVSVNHLKSKGSACDLPDQGDGQGACNQVRTTAAQLLADWLATDPTGVGDPDVLVVGDLNAYSREDPVTALVQAGYTDLVPAFGGGTSYVFDGQWGSLDHALASASLQVQVAAAHDWYINAEEPGVLDYNTNFKSAGQIASLYAPDEFRVADHNPLLVDLDLETPMDTSSRIYGSGELQLVNPGGSTAGDAGSILSARLSVRFRKGRQTPHGDVLIVLRRTVEGVQRTYRLKDTAIVAAVRDLTTGTAVVVARATLSDITEPETPVLLEKGMTVRISLDDNGSPGADADTLGVTVFDSASSLWFSSEGGSPALEMPNVAGNLKVR